MAEISASMVKELREKSGAGMMDCKKALNEVGGDLEAAVDWLRKKGLAAAAKKAGRVAAEGLVGVASQGTSGALVEINAETDFVARNDKFQNLVQKVTEIVLKTKITDIQSLSSQAFPGESPTVAEEVTRLISVIGENMNLRRAIHLNVPHGIVASYIHNSVVPGMGKIGVLVALESKGDSASLLELGKKIAMHVAAANPQALTIEEVDPVALQRERDVLTEQARISGKPEEFISKMVDGRLRKYYEEVVLTEQVFVMDGQSRVSQVIEEAAKSLGHPIKLAGFVRYALGEGIEKKESDFASEVMAQAGVS